VVWSIEAQCLPMALRLPLQTIGALGSSLWQLQVALRPYTSRNGSGSRVIGRIFSMDEKRAVVKEAYASAARQVCSPCRAVRQQLSSLAQSYAQVQRFLTEGKRHGKAVRCPKTFIKRSSAPT
jgi:hypothetical protein